MTDSMAPFGADLGGVIVGLEEYTVLDAVDDGELTVEVMPARGEAPCRSCGVFSARVKSRRASTIRDCQPRLPGQAHRHPTPALT